MSSTNTSVFHGSGAIINVIGDTFVIASSNSVHEIFDDPVHARIVFIEILIKIIIQNLKQSKLNKSYKKSIVKTDYFS